MAGKNRKCNGYRWICQGRKENAKDIGICQGRIENAKNIDGYAREDINIRCDTKG